MITNAHLLYHRKAVTGFGDWDMTLICNEKLFPLGSKFEKNNAYWLSHFNSSQSTLMN